MRGLSIVIAAIAGVVAFLGSLAWGYDGHGSDVPVPVGFISFVMSLVTAFVLTSGCGSTRLAGGLVLLAVAVLVDISLAVTITPRDIDLIERASASLRPYFWLWCVVAFLWQFAALAFVARHLLMARRPH